MPIEVVNCVPERSRRIWPSAVVPDQLTLFSRIDSGETRTITCSHGIQEGYPMGPELFCLALRPGMKCFGENIEGKEWKPPTT